MDTPISKPKYDRATTEQLQFYVHFCRERPHFLIGKNSPKSPRQMQELWNELADGLNALRGPTRTEMKWKETLGVWKSQLRTRARRIKMSQRLTGGGPLANPMSEFEELTLSTFGMAAVEGATSSGSFGLTLPQQALPLECPVEVSLPSLGDAMANPGASMEGNTSFLSQAVSSPSVVLTEPGAVLSQELISENQSDSEGNVSMTTVRPTRLERKKLIDQIIANMKKRDEREKQRDEREKQREEREKQREEREQRQNILREQQQRDTAQALQALTNCMSQFLDEIKKINNQT